jgi:hypothetical protein
MLQITAKKINSTWSVINADGRGYSDVLEICRLAGVEYKYNAISNNHKTKKSALAALKSVAELASRLI